MEEKIEKHKERIRARLEAKGLEYDEVEDYIATLFDRLEEQS